MMSADPLHVLGKTRRRGRFVPAMALLVLVLAAGDVMVRAAESAGKAGAYQGPCALVASKDGKTLYVANADAQQVVWVDLPGGHVTRRIALPAEPTGLAISPDGTKLIVTCAASKSTVAIFDAVLGKPMGVFPAGHTAVSPTISPDGKRLYVCNRFDNDVSVIDLGTGKEVARVPVVREPIAAAVTPDGRAVLVANHLPNTGIEDGFKGYVTPVVTVIDTGTHETAAIELSHGAHSLRDVCVSPDGRHAFVTHLLANFEMIPFRVGMGWINVNVVSIIDTRKWKVVSTIGMDENDLGAGNPWDVTFTADGRTVCVSLAGADELCVIDSAELLGELARNTMQPMMGVWPIYTSLGASLWRRIKLPGKGPRGLAAAGSKVYVAQYFSDSIVTVDPRAAEDVPLETIELGPPPQLTLERRGQLLFHDATLCYQQWISCTSCHPDGRVDGLNWDLMNDGAGNPKSTKSMLLTYRTPPSMAEGVRDTAELAVRSGLTHILFADRPEEEAVAIDAYLKSLRPVPSPHLMGGQLNAAAKRGQQLFESERIACHRCHPGPLYTDLRSHDVGSRRRNEYTNRFDTPTLVEVWRTAPYLHDGRYATVKELLVEGKHGLRRRRSELTEQDMNDLVEFVLSL